jgi:hypothetical protein
MVIGLLTFLIPIKEIKGIIDSRIIIIKESHRKALMNGKEKKVQKTPFLTH